MFNAEVYGWGEKKKDEKRKWVFGTGCALARVWEKSGRVWRCVAAAVHQWCGAGGFLPTCGLLFLWSIHSPVSQCGVKPC